MEIRIILFPPHDDVAIECHPRRITERHWVDFHVELEQACFPCHRANAEAFYKITDYQSELIATRRSRT